jgi:hypothetical protein
MSMTALGFIGLYAVALGLAFVRHPIYGLYAYMLSFYQHPQSRWWGADLPEMRLSLVAAVVTLLAVVMYRDSRK